MLYRRSEKNQHSLGCSDNVFMPGIQTGDVLTQGILDSIDVMMAVLDTNGRICAVNEAWQRQAQKFCSSEQVERTGIGVNYLEICRQTQGSSVPEATEAFKGIEGVLQGTRSAFTQEYGCASPTELRWYMMRVTPLPQNRGAVVAHIDITERKQLDMQKDLFISIASHELRTPLTILKGLTQAERRRSAKRGSEVSVQSLTNMELQVDHLTKLVSELLDVSKMQAGRLDYVQEVVDLDRLIYEVVETTRQTDASHTLKVHGASGAKIVGDRDKLEQVFTNLLSNAIKYSPQASQIDLSLEASLRMVQVRIRDYGIGIPEEHRSKLFERFYRVDTSGHNYVPGLGMGLYIVQEILQHHGGTIMVESEPGKGSTFLVSLPLQPV
jgi:signal transduction histidine kinase